MMPRALPRCSKDADDDAMPRKERARCYFYARLFTLESAEARRDKRRGARAMMRDDMRESAYARARKSEKECSKEFVYE